MFNTGNKVMTLKGDRILKLPIGATGNIIDVLRHPITGITFYKILMDETYSGFKTWWFHPSHLMLI